MQKTCRRIYLFLVAFLCFTCLSFAQENKNPVARAGTDTTIYYPFNVITLDGSQSYTAGGKIFWWEKISGPASYNIKNPTRAVTEVRELVPGVYVFELTVRDYGRNSDTDKITVTVLPDQTQPGNVPYTANTKVPAYNKTFQYGTNPSAYGNGWGDTAIAGIALKAGVHSIRLPLPDRFVGHYGYDIRLDAFNYYTHHLGMKELTLFVGKPRPGYGKAHTDVFGNLYKSIWDQGENGTPVNDQNYFAVYIYNLVKFYGDKIRFWEIVNEPDMTGFWDNGNKNHPNNWWDNPPGSDALINLEAPIFNYIRMLRVSYEVIKKFYPDSYVAPGGIGYPAFLDALLRYTDNPDGGKVTAEYPLKGGAYFDMVSFHCYPVYLLQEWDNSIGGFRHFRHSDGAANAIIRLKNTLDSVLIIHGYNGKKYPKKPFIITESNIPRKTFGTYWGANDAQRNFIIKALVQSQVHHIKQFYTYQIGETEDYNSATGAYGLMGLYENLKRDKYGYERLTDEGKAFKTTSHLLYGWRYDSLRTNQMNLSANIDGAAFKKGNKYRYVLWAKTQIDKSEEAHATYSFPASFHLLRVFKYDWNYSVNPNAKSKISPDSIVLTGSPVFFSKAKVPDSVNRPPVADAGKDRIITLPANSIVLNGHQSEDPDGAIVSYKWTKSSGPSSFYFSDSTEVQTKISGLVPGIYSFTLTVTDDKGATSSDMVAVIVQNVINQMPVAHVGADQTITLPEDSVFLDGSTSSDPDGDITGYNWTKTAGPNNYTFENSNTAKTKVSDLTEGTYVFTLTVTDDNGASTSTEVKITVKVAKNQVPVAHAGADQTIKLPKDSVFLDGSTSSDSDGTIDSYQWEKTSGPADFTFENGTLAQTKVSDLSEGTYIFTLTVTDDKGATATDEIKLTVKAPDNQKPVANAGTEQTIILSEDSVFLDGSASSDPDGTIKSYQWEKTAGPNNYTFENRNTAKTKVSDLSEGTYVFTLTVTDDKGATAIDKVKITVNLPYNQMPVANAGANQTITLPTNAVFLDGSASYDSDGKYMQCKWEKTSGPDNYTFDNRDTTRTKVADLSEGIYIFTLTVTDDKGATTTDQVRITVKAAKNQPPVANAGEDQTITLPTNTVILDGTKSNDPDGKIIDYHWKKTAGPANYAVKNNTLPQTIVSGLSEGTYRFTLSVTDDKGVVSTDEVKVIVVPRDNQVPVANAGKNQTITLPVNTITLDGTKSNDPDGKITDYQWTKTAGPVTFRFENTNRSTTKVSGLIKGTYIFTLTVTDDKGVTSTDDIEVTVNRFPENQAPIAAVQDKDIITFLSNNSTILDGSPSKDPDGSIVQYRWVQEKGPTSTTIDQPKKAYTKITGLGVGTYIFTLTVIDNQGATDSISVTVHVYETSNRSPVAKTEGDIVVTRPKSSAMLNGTASYDPDGQIVNYNWKQLSGPTQATLAQQNTAICQASNLKTGIYHFMLTVTDNKGATSTAKADVFVGLDVALDVTKFYVYPNPVTGNTLHVKLNKIETGIIRFRIIDMNGKVLRKYKLDAYPSHIIKDLNISGLADGIYLIQLIEDKQLRAVRKFICE